MALSIGVVEKEYNQLFKEREVLTESVNKLEQELASKKSQLNAVHGGVQALEKLLRKAESDLTLREAEKELKEKQNG